jgi:ornithine cyclodeaminase/alanine dehydrogenase-like protein (mu-crystallin family)
MKSERVSKSLLIFGSGAQALSHATFFLALHPTISSCTFIVRKSTPRSKSLLRTLESQFPNVDFEIGESTYTQQTDDQSFQEPVEPFAASSTPFNLSQVVHNANIIICATPSTEPLFNSVDVTSQTRIILIGSYKPHMREVDNELIRRAGLVVVDSAEACLAESGELIGSKKRDEDLVELGELVDDEELRDKVVKSGDIVLFKSASLLVRPCLFN